MDTPRGVNPDGRAGRARPKLHYVYFALAAFDLLTVSLGLYLIDRIAAIYTDSVAVNLVWANRLSDYADLSRLAAEVNAPGNDVFETGDVDREAARLAQRVAAFDAEAASVRADVTRNVEPARAAGLVRALDAIDAAMAEMVAEANLIFSYFRNDQPERAGRRMAEMDRHFVRVNATLAELGDRVRAIQRSHFDEQMARAATLRKFEYLIAGLIVLMVTGVTIYGHRLARGMKAAARETQTHLEALARSREEVTRHRDHLEELVAARTVALESSHAQLRMAERLASMGTLAAGLGHDMNNVLFPVRCRLDALEAAELTPEARAEVAALRQSILYLQQLSDGLRLLAQDPDDGRVPETATPLGAWAVEAQPLFRTALPRGARLEWALPEDMPAPAVAPHRLTQAVFNLVVNAGEAIAGEGTVRVWGETLDDGRVVRIGVTDDGPGMPEEIRQRVLDPFFTTKTRGLSTGLGLALVHGVVKGAGGTVEIDSAPGRGTTVALNLPVAGRSAEPRLQAACRATISVPDDRIATLATALLESAGYEVARTNGETPVSGALWIADAGCTAPEAAEQFLREAPDRCVVVIGDASERWTAIGADVAGPEGPLESIRRAIGAARPAVMEDA